MLSNAEPVQCARGVVITIGRPAIGTCALNHGHGPLSQGGYAAGPGPPGGGVLVLPGRSLGPGSTYRYPARLPAHTVPDQVPISCTQSVLLKSYTVITC